MARRILALKLRALINTRLLADGSAALTFLLGAVFGLVMILVGGLEFAAAGPMAHNDAVSHVALRAALVTAGWLTIPLLYGVDDLLPVARFAVFPLTRRQLTTGLLAASLVSVPAVVTLLATSGLVFAAAGHGVVPAFFALAGVVLGLLLCLVASRAITTPFARMLASRRTRDLVSFLGFLGMAGLWLMWTAYSSRLTELSLDSRLLPVARVLAWTPLAAPHTAWLDVVRGNEIAAVAKLLITVAAILVLQWSWGRSLTAVLSGAAEPRRGGGGRAHLAAEVPPRSLRRLLPATTTGAIVARALRQWLRDNRFRVAVLSGLSLPLMLAVVSTPNPAVLAMLVGCAMGAGPGNVFGFDGPAYATHVLAGVPGRLDLRARTIANVLVAVPVTLTVALAVCQWQGNTAAVVPTIAAGLAGIGCGAATAALFAARIPFVAPPPDKPFTTPPGSHLPAVINGIGTIVGGILLTLPALALTSVMAPWPALPVAVAWGVVVAEAAVWAGGRHVDSHGPEIIQAVAPR